MMHDASHRTEATLNRAYGPWNLKAPQNNWEKFSANDKQSGGLAGVGTCHWPANAEGDYDYGNKRVVASWADAFLSYPKLDLTRKKVTRDTWSNGPDHQLDYMKWYFAHIPRAAGVNDDGRQNNWFKYIFDFQSYDAKGQPLPAAAALCFGDVADPKASEHTLRVAYRSAEQIDPTSLGDDDLEVTSPDGKALAVQLVGGNEPGGRSYRVARYRVAAPGGSWDKARAGEFAVVLRKDRVRTRTGTVLPSARLGGFRVSRAGSEAEPMAAAGVVTLALDVPAGPLAIGTRAVARATGRTKAGLALDQTRNVAWASSDPAVLAVDPDGTLRAARTGLATLTARLGALSAMATVKVTDPGLPKARLVKAPDVTRKGRGDVTVVVAYEAPAGIRLDSLGLGNVRVAGPNGFSLFAELVGPPALAGRTVTASYRVKPLTGKWGDADRGVYTIELKAFQVADVKGNYAPEMVLGQFHVLRQTTPK
jgi:hypothetical protein